MKIISHTCRSETFPVKMTLWHMQPVESATCWLEKVSDFGLFSSCAIKNRLVSCEDTSNKVFCCGDSENAMKCSRFQCKLC